MFCLVWKRVNTNRILKVCVTYVVIEFFLASDCRWFLGTKRYFATNVRIIFPLGQSSSSLCRSDKLLYELNKLLCIIVLFNSLWYSCVILIGYVFPLLWLHSRPQTLLRASFQYIIQYWLLELLLVHLGFVLNFLK